MTAQASNNAITLFDAQVKHELEQSETLLKPICRIRTGNSKTFTFNRFGSAIASKRTSSTSKVQHQNVEQDNVTVNVEDYESFTLAGKTDLEKMNYDERKELAVVTARSAMQRQEQIIIDAMDSGKSSTSFGADGTSWTLSDFLDIEALFDEYGIPSAERYYVAHPKTIAKMRAIEQVSSGDYHKYQTFNDGKLPSFGSFKIIQIGDLGGNGNGLPKDSTTNVRSNFAVHGGSTGALAFVQSCDVKNSVDWLPEYRSYQVGTEFSCAAKVIGSLTTGKEGIYEHKVDEAV